MRRLLSILTLAVATAAATALCAQEEDSAQDSAAARSESAGEARPAEPPGGDDGLTPDLDDGLDELLGGHESATGSVLRSWKGFIEIKPRIYFFDRDEGKNDEQLLFDSEFEFDFLFSERWSGYLRTRVFLDALDGDLKRFEPYDGYLTLHGESWDLRGGQFVENWGIVDTYNPLDVLNRRDFATDILDATRLGELGLRFRYLFAGNDLLGEPTVSLYAMPIFRETLFPPDDQRFGFGTDALPFDEDGGFEPEGLEQGFYALRFQSTLNTGPLNADAQLVVAAGPDRLPLLSIDRGELIPVYYGALTIGAGFRAVPNQDTLGDFLSTLTLKGEAVYKETYSFDDSPLSAPDNYFAYVVGMDRAFYSIFTDRDQVILTVEYAGEEGADLSSSPAPGDPGIFLLPFQNDVIVRTLWEANDFNRMSLELRGFYDFDNDETIFEAIYQTQLRFIHEDLKLIAQLQLFDPADAEDSFFGFFLDNSSAAIGLRWDF